MNQLYLNISHASGYIEEKGVNRYLIFDSTDENEELIKKYSDVFTGIRDDRQTYKHIKNARIWQN